MDGCQRPSDICYQLLWEPENRNRFSCIYKLAIKMIFTTISSFMEGKKGEKIIFKPTANILPIVIFFIWCLLLYMNPCVRLARCIVTVAVISHLTQPAAYTGQCVGLGWAWGVRGGLGNGGTAGLRGGRRHGAVLGAAWCWSACVKCHQLCSDTWCLHINYFGNRNHNSLS